MLKDKNSVHPFAATLLSWFAEYGRCLPWRETTDPYAIWLSEVVLQQTRIDQGTSYWHRLMERFPSVEELAAADEDEVLLQWQGLGYYSRARNLHHAARQIVEMGQFPSSFKALQSLKGVGRYTAAAIASFAFGECVAVVDGNVYRVLARYFGIDTPINSSAGERLFFSLAQELIPASAPALFNQAMMDFGALCCTPSSPHCSLCPLSLSCHALRAQLTSSLPIKLKKVKVKERRMAWLIVIHQDSIALRRRGAGDIWQGLWEPVNLIDDPHVSSHVLLSTRRAWMSVAEGHRHLLTHRLLLADFHLYRPEERPPLPEGYLWVRLSELQNYALPQLMVEVFNKCIK